MSAMRAGRWARLLLLWIGLWSLFTMPAALRAWADSEKLPQQDPAVVTDGQYLIYAIRVPNTGTLEVGLKPTRYTTRLALEFEEFPDL